MSFDIQGKVALVTGANRGIGKAIVESFIQHGASKVYAAVRTLSTADPLVAAHGDKVVPIQVDLADAATVAKAAEVATDVDIVVNNAGVLKTTTPFDENTYDNLKFEMNINVFGLLHVARAFAPVLKANGGGVLAQLNSVVSMKNFSAFTTYCASKAASYSITQSLRETLKEQGTYVLSVHPGPIATDMGDDAGLSAIAEPPSQVPEAMIEAMRQGEFHVFTDTMAKQLGAAYESFAKNVIEADMMEG